MEKILAAWELGPLQEYLNIRDQLEKYGKTDEDVKRYIDDSRKRRMRHRELQYTAIKCPKCDSDMILESINVDPKGRDRIGSLAHKSWWRCEKDQTTIYNTKTYEEEMESLMYMAEMKTVKKGR